MSDAGAEWRRISRGGVQATLAHAPEWFTVIPRAYGHQPLYFAAEDEAGACGLLPAFVVRRPLFGTVVASMPFLDSGGPCASSPQLMARLIDHLIAEAREIGARTLEMRAATPLPIDVPPMRHKVTLTLALCADHESVWRSLDKDVRNKVRRAERCGLSIDSAGTAHLVEFYDVFAARMRDLGSPVHGLEFLRATLEEFGARARVLIVRRRGAPIGGLLALAFNDTLSVPWAACLREHFHLRPNMLLYWEAIRAACREGFRRFDFGRSTIDSGTYRFKRQWGAREEPLFWYTIPLLGRARTGSTGRAGSMTALLTGTWQRLPLPLTRRLGPHVRKYLIE